MCDVFAESGSPRTPEGGLTPYLQPEGTTLPFRYPVVGSGQSFLFSYKKPSPVYWTLVQLYLERFQRELLRDRFNQEGNDETRFIFRRVFLLEEICVDNLKIQRVRA